MDHTVVHVCRHGEVDNPDGILYGRLPGYHLSDLGRTMASNLADFFTDRNSDIVAVISSPLERAVETATPTAQAYKLPVMRDKRLTEAGNKFQGRAIRKNVVGLLRPQWLPRYVNPLRPSWGEPYRDQAQRMVQAVRAARQAALGHEAVVVSHQLPIWCMRLFIEGRPLAHLPSRRECSLTSVTSLTFDGATLVGLSYHEPAGDLLKQAHDMTPGRSEADTDFSKD